MCHWLCCAYARRNLILDLFTDALACVLCSIASALPDVTTCPHDRSRSLVEPEAAAQNGYCSSRCSSGFGTQALWLVAHAGKDTWPPLMHVHSKQSGHRAAVNEQGAPCCYPRSSDLPLLWEQDGSGATASTAKVLAASDCLRDARFEGVPWVAHGPVRAYAAAPLLAAGGQCVGYLCVAHDSAVTCVCVARAGRPMVANTDCEHIDLPPWRRHSGLILKAVFFGS
jgi:GAF domain-containing protein